MKVLRFLGVILYSGYLVHVGLLLVILPWSQAWGNIVVRLSPDMALLMDAPWLRGLVSAFGVLHLLLLAWELVRPTAFDGIAERHQDVSRT